LICNKFLGLNKGDVVWVPRIFLADIDFPEELPDARGLDWAEYDEDWMSAKDFEKRYKKDVRIREQLELFEKGVVGCVVVDGVE